MKSRSALLLLALLTLSACGREPSATASVPTTAAPSAAAPAPSSTSAAATVKDLTVKNQEGTATGATSDPSQAELERIAALPAEGQLPVGKWVAGTNYQVLVPAQPTDVAAGKVEVIEAFWYGCPHCYALDPYLESWRKNKPAYIEFVRVPVTWQPIHRAHARLYYTLQALGKLEQLHTKVFDEIHQNNNPLYIEGDEQGTLKLQSAFALANGISAADFAQAYNSFGVQTSLQKAEDLVERYKIDGVPTIVINGKYVTDVGMAGNQTNLLQLINDLAASEKRH